MRLSIQNLNVYLKETQILKDINFEVAKGEIVVLMGPNGSGKSTLAHAIMGNPLYRINQGRLKTRAKILLEGKEITGLSTDAKAKKGIYLAFQNPVGIAGVSVANLIRTAYRQRFGLTEKKKSYHNPVFSMIDINEKLLEESMNLNIPRDFLSRSLNEEFSGGEKKKLEMLQAVMLKPKVAIFDEIDTGLDVDALKIIAKGINRLKKEGVGILIITHYLRILEHVRPDRVLVLIKGKFVESGDMKLASFIEKNGFGKWLSETK